MQTVDSSPGHITGPAVVHSPGALLHYVHNNWLSELVEPYVGCSHPMCYPCVTLVRAYGWGFLRGLAVGPQCSDLNALDVAWAYPPGMSLAVCRRLEKGPRRGFNELCIRLKECGVCSTGEHRLHQYHPSHHHPVLAFIQ